MEYVSKTSSGANRKYINKNATEARYDDMEFQLNVLG